MALEHPRILVSAVGPGNNPLWILRDNWMYIFDYMGVSTSNPHVVEGSTVYLYLYYNSINEQLIDKYVD